MLLQRAPLDIACVVGPDYPECKLVWPRAMRAQDYICVHVRAVELVIKLNVFRFSGNLVSNVPFVWGTGTQCRLHLKELCKTASTPWCQQNSSLNTLSHLPHESSSQSHVTKQLMLCQCRSQDQADRSQCGSPA